MCVIIPERADEESCDNLVKQPIYVGVGYQSGLQISPVHLISESD